MKLSTLIERYGADFAAPDLRTTLNAGCEHANAMVNQQCDLYFPQLMRGLPAGKSPLHKTSKDRAALFNSERLHAVERMRQAQARTHAGICKESRQPYLPSTARQESAQPPESRRQ